MNTFSGTDASICSYADAEADAAAKRQSDAYTAARGGSLVEKFLKSKGGKKAGGADKREGGGGPGGWDRDRDLESRSISTVEDVQKMVQQAKEMGSRFARPSASRNFI